VRRAGQKERFYRETAGSLRSSLSPAARGFWTCSADASCFAVVAGAAGS
jgi:hypothetical protein